MTEKPIQKIYLVRHGETEWSLSGQHTGMTDIPLTENGKRMAKELEPFFAKQKLSLVLTSPLERARMTCELAGLGDKAEVDPNLMEWDYGEYEGLTREQIHTQSLNWMIFKDGCPGGESPKQVEKRADQVIARINKAEGTVVLFAHGHILRVLVSRWLGFSAEAGSHFLLDTGTISILSYYEGCQAVKQWNAPLVSAP